MSTDHPTILVADDDKELLKALSLRLWNMGYEIITATDSNQVIALANEASPDAIVLDVNMPSGDGFSVHERLKQITSLRQTPVIYVTGDRSSRLDSLARELGAVALLHKPFRIDELVAMLDQSIKPNAAPMGLK